MRIQFSKRHIIGTPLIKKCSKRLVFKCQQKILKIQLKWFLKLLKGFYLHLGINLTSTTAEKDKEKLKMRKRKQCKISRLRTNISSNKTWIKRHKRFLQINSNNKYTAWFTTKWASKIINNLWMKFKITWRLCNKVPKIKINLIKCNSKWIKMTFSKNRSNSLANKRALKKSLQKKMEQSTNSEKQ